MRGAAAIFSSRSDEWTTPPDLYEKLDSEFHFTDDPCPINGAADGLFRDWSGNVFVNPPYSDIGSFIEKALVELASGRASVVVFLIPARTDTRWFHELVYGKAEIRFIKGRLKFGGRGPAPFPSMIVVFRHANLPE